MMQIAQDHLDQREKISIFEGRYYFKMGHE